MTWIETPHSSAIVRFGYHAAGQILGVQYRSGETYSYRRVPEKVFQEMCAAPSRGRFVTSRIKNIYAYERR